MHCSVQHGNLTGSWGLHSKPSAMVQFVVQQGSRSQLSPQSHSSSASTIPLPQKERELSKQPLFERTMLAMLLRLQGEKSRLLGFVPSVADGNIM